MPKGINEWREEARKRGFKSAREWLNTVYDEGNPISVIARDVGMTKSGTQKLLKRFGVVMRPRGGPNRV